MSLARAGSALVLLVTLAACGDDGAAGHDATPFDPTPDFAEGAMRVDVRSQLFDGGGATTVSALLSSAPSPWPYDPPALSGSCRMFRRHDIDNCSPACPSSAMCDDGTCRPFPTPQSAGTLTISGGASSRAIPFDDGYQLYLPTALFAPGTDITARAPGATLPGFELTARLPAGLTLLATDQLRLAVGHELTLRWTPAGDGDRIRVILGADLGHAMWRTVVIECDLPDAAGAVTVPQAMVDVLADRSNWSCGDCFSHEVRRYRRADGTFGGTSMSLWTLQSQSLYLVPDRP